MILPNSRKRGEDAEGAEGTGKGEGGRLRYGCWGDGRPAQYTYNMEVATIIVRITPLSPHVLKFLLSDVSGWTWGAS